MMSSAFAIRIFLTSLVVFVLSVGIVEALLWICRIKHPRAKAICRFVPLLKLPLDIVLFKWLSLQGIYVLSFFGCNGVFKWLLTLLFPEFTRKLALSDLTILETAMTQLPPEAPICLLAFLVTISTALVARKTYQLFRSHTYIQEINQHSYTNTRIISNPLLKNTINKSKTTILVSDLICVPFATWDNTIYIPRQLSYHLEQAEFEAVVAHELEHLQWHDPLTRIVGEMIASLFWWVPTKSLLKRIEEAQERASDAAPLQYALDIKALASAIYKTTKSQHQMIQPAFTCKLTGKLNPCVLRVNAILLMKGPVPALHARTKLIILATTIALLGSTACIC